MNITRVVVLVAIAAALGLGVVYFTRVGGPADVAEPTSPQAGMSGMSGMSGMDGMSGMNGMGGAGEPDCIRYDLIDGVWTCTATGAGAGAAGN